MHRPDGERPPDARAHYEYTVNDRLAIAAGMIRGLLQRTDVEIDALTRERLETALRIVDGEGTTVRAGSKLLENLRATTAKVKRLPGTIPASRTSSRRGDER